MNPHLGALKLDDIDCWAEPEEVLDLFAGSDMHPLSCRWMKTKWIVTFLSDGDAMIAWRFLCGKLFKVGSQPFYIITYAYKNDYYFDPLGPAFYGLYQEEDRTGWRSPPC